jgi:aspartate aminotransferase
MTAKRAAGISPSLTLAITAKANKLKAEGLNVIGFGAGEPDFNTPQYIIDAAKEALDKGFTKYTPSGGTAQLKAAIAKKFKDDNGIDYAPAQILVSNGAKHSLFNACQAIVDPGDEVIIPAPYWLTYPELVKLSDGVPVYVKCAEKNGLKLTPDALKAAITPKTKALILNSPCNPTGAVYSETEIKAIARVVEDAGITVISDEIYEKLVYGGARHYSIASYSQKLYDNTITVNGLSKTYSMTGWRIGYFGAPLAITKAADNMQSHTSSNANSIAQYAATAALAGGADFLREMVGVFDVRRRFMIDRIAKIPGVGAVEPQGAFYVMLNVTGLYGKSFGGRTITSAHTAAELMLEFANAAVVPGEAFGADGYVRISYAISQKDIATGLDNIEAFIRKLK